MSDTDLYKHRSDCAVHNEPAYPAGPCDCGAEPPTSNRKKLRQANLRIGRQREKIAELLRTIADLSTQLYNSHDRADAAEAALDKAAALIEERHVVHMTAKGRNPKDYISEWSLIAKEVRAMLVELKGESHE